MRRTNTDVMKDRLFELIEKISEKLPLSLQEQADCVEFGLLDYTNAVSCYEAILRTF